MNKNMHVKLDHLPRDPGVNIKFKTTTLGGFLLEKIPPLDPSFPWKMRFFFLVFFFEIWVISPTNEGTSGFPRQGTHPTETHGKSCTPKCPTRVGYVGNPREASWFLVKKPWGGIFLIPDYCFGYSFPRYITHTIHVWYIYLHLP